MKKAHNKKIKKKNIKKKKTFLFFFSKVVSIFAMLIILISIVFVIDSFFLSKDKIMRNIYFVDRNVGGMNKQEFSSYIEEYKGGVFVKKVFLNVEGTEIIVLPNQIGLDFNVENLWEKISHERRDENIGKRFSSWLSSLHSRENTTLSVFSNNELYEKYRRAWEHDSQLPEPFEGAVQIVDGHVLVRMPEHGKEIDAEALLEQIINGFLYEGPEINIIAPIKRKSFTRNIEDLENLKAQTESFIKKSVYLENKDYDGVSLELSTEDLIDIIEVSLPQDTNIKPEVYINESSFLQKFAKLKVKDAEFSLNEDYSVEVIPAQDGVDIDLEKTKENLLLALKEDKRNDVLISVHEVYSPEFSSKEARDLGIKHLVSEFTTHHPCCAARVENIQKIADMLDGVIIKPGEEFNVNTYVGERTEEKGFKNAGSIFKGEMVDSVGGGISQFITTLHNVVYWGGYEIVTHKPHSIYFLRYPHGIEATINWPYVDYVFKNDTDAVIVIDTEYTDTSITVRILGNNDGRIMRGDHKSWSTPMEVLSPGGDLARRVDSHVKDAFDFRPPVVRYKSDPSIPRGTSQFYKKGKDGWKTIVNRKVFIDEELYRHDIWPVYYTSGSDTIYLVNPCENPNEEKPKSCYL